MAPTEYTSYEFVAYTGHDLDKNQVWIIGKICIFSLSFKYTSDYTPSDTQVFIRKMPRPKRKTILNGVNFNGTKCETFRFLVSPSSDGVYGEVTNNYSKITTKANNPTHVMGCYILA